MVTISKPTSSSSSSGTSTSPSLISRFFDEFTKLFLRSSSTSDSIVVKYLNVIRQSYWLFLYNLLSRRVIDNRLQLFNYGYVPDDGHIIELPDDYFITDDMSTEEKMIAKQNQNKSRTPAHTSMQLYYEVVTAVDIKDKNLIEIGCGRGGGVSYIARYLHPKTITGIDFSTTSIQFANKIQKPKCTNPEMIQFQVGDAMDLHTIQSSAYDVVVNVESSHCYPDFNKFINEVYRILVPNGYCVMCDLRIVDDLKLMEQSIIDCGFIITNKINITSNVVKSLKECSHLREKSMKSKFGNILYPFLHMLVGNFCAYEGSSLYNSLQNNTLIYMRYVLHKPVIVTN